MAHGSIGGLVLEPNMEAMEVMEEVAVEVEVEEVEVEAVVVAGTAARAAS
jgi:hypothetical protein